MIFNLLVALFIVLITLYMASQGLLTALLALITATFSSILAMALTEPLESLVGKVSIEYQRGLTFLLLFLITFGVTRVVADLIVTRNIKLPLLVNRITGGLIGFFVGMVVVGTLVIGIEQMPLPSTLLGYDRFPGSTNMQGLEPGVPTNAQAGVWFAPDQFTIALWNGASGRGLGGNRPFSAVHPNLSVESYGYRRNNQFASKRTVPPEQFEVPAVWASADPKDLTPLGIQLEGGGKKAVIARTVVTQGEKLERSAADVDAKYFRITPSQVRLVTDKGKQYYPIGYLEFGTQFVKLDLETGQLVDDFVRSKVAEDWVFQIGDDEKPVLIEMKQTARKELAEVKDKPLPPLAQGDYPQKPYQKERSSLAVNLSGVDAVTDGKVYVLRGATIRKEVDSEVRSAQGKVEDILSSMENGTGGWSNTEKPGLPSRSYFEEARRISINYIVNKDPKDSVQMDYALKVMLAGQFQSDAARSIPSLSSYVNGTLLPLFARVSTGNPIIAQGTLETGGKAQVTNIPKGKAVILTVARTEKAFYAWISDMEFSKGDQTLTLNPNQTQIKAVRQD
jgi:hypothetical protein